MTSLINMGPSDEQDPPIAKLVLKDVIESTTRPLITENDPPMRIAESVLRVRPTCMSSVTDSGPPNRDPRVIELDPAEVRSADIDSPESILISPPTVSAAPTRARLVEEN
jgi:hypothetical protein